MGWSLDRIVHVEIWATDTIHADLPPMVEFKKKADAIIKERWGIEVEHIRGKYTYEQIFYRCKTKSKIGNNGEMYGWPRLQRGQWCTGELKQSVIGKEQKGRKVYLGIAADEPERISRHGKKPGNMLPLVEAGWTEADCRQWCKANDLLSPIYTTATRGGCWFCHNQSVNQLRLLRRNYPEYWKLMLKWDKDSPVTFHADGHTVHDFEHRFHLEDDGFLIPGDRKFKWRMLDDDLQQRLF